MAGIDRSEKLHHAVHLVVVLSLRKAGQFILEGLEPSQVRVFFPDEKGGIVVRPLSEHPDARRAIGALSAGQIWTLSPEKWVLERP